MSPLGVLLRVVLCISLLLNGAGAAVAATRMPMVHATTATTATPSRDTTPAYCHDAPGMGSLAAQHAIAASDNGTDTATSPHGTPDCCKASRCDCSCVQHAQVAITAMRMDVSAMGRRAGVRPMTTGHTPPVQAQLIRPPIG